jgi:hypothetical protein
MINLLLKEVDNEIAKKMIIKNHYSHTIAFGVSLSLGIFRTGSETKFFSNVNDDKLMGCVVFSVPVGAQVHKGISPEIKNQNEVFELTSLWVSDELGKNTESWAISQSMDFIRKNYKNIKVLISYSDIGQKHLGYIYQATNWIYQGQFFHKDILYSFDEGRTWKHNKGLRNVYKATTHEELVKILPKPFLFKYTSPKHRYLYILGNKVERRKIFSSLVYKPFPYPKKIEENSEEVHRVEDGVAEELHVAGRNFFD